MAIVWSGNSGHMYIGIEAWVVSGPHADGKVILHADYYIQAESGWAHHWTYPWHWSGTGGSGSQNVTYNSTVSNQPLAKISSWDVAVWAEYGHSTTATFNASLGPIWNGGAPSVSATVTVPARPYSAPLTPTNVMVARVNDNRIDLSWSATSTTSAPVLGTYIERRTQSDMTWRHVADVGGSARSWTDTAVRPNERYWYRVWTHSGTLWSGAAESSSVSTTPAAPYDVTAEKQSNTHILVSWKSAAPYPGTGWRIYDNGDMVWETDAPTPLTFTHQASPEKTHTYSVEMLEGSLVSARSATSQTVQLLAPPLAPTLLAPFGTSLTGNVTFKWRHNPVDSSVQKAATIRYRKINGPWTTKTVTTVSELMVTCSAGLYEWQAQTKGLHNDWSPWSPLHVFEIADKPKISITTPSNGSTITKPRLTVNWSYSQAQWHVQTQAQAQVYLGDKMIEQSFSQGTGTSFELSTTFQNGRDYEIHLRAQSSSGFWSDWKQINIHVSFPLPPEPKVNVSWDAAQKAAKVTVTNPAPTNSDAAAVRNIVERSITNGLTWELVPTSPGLVSNVIDTGSLKHGETLYRVTAYSEAGASSNTVTKGVVPSDAPHLKSPEIKRGCATREVWFSVGGKGAWFPSPQVGMTANNVSWGNNTQLINGMNTVVGSTYASRIYNLSWNHLMREQAQLFEELFLTAGMKNVFFLDPFANQNILSQLGSMPYLHVEAMTPSAFNVYGEPIAAVFDDKSIRFRDVVESGSQYTETVHVPYGKYLALYVKGNGAQYSGVKVNETPVPGNVVYPFDGNKVAHITLDPLSNTEINYVAARILPWTDPIPKSIDFAYPAGGGNMRVVPGSAILTPTTNATGVYTASLSLQEVWAWV